MLKSMTGFGSAQGKIASRNVIIEVKAVNHKFCEVNLRAPTRYSILEGKVVEFSRSFFTRGRIDIFIKDDYKSSNSKIAKLDLDKLKSYQKSLQKAAKTLKLSDEISWSNLLALPYVLVTEEEEDLEQIWKQLKPLLEKSFQSLEGMRKKEGLALTNFLKDQMEALKKRVSFIEKELPQNIENYQKLLQDRLAKIAKGVELDPQRLIQEVAYFVDRSDVSEELQRLKHHIDYFQDIIQSREPVGRKLDFLLQEMNREVNTLSAKAQNAVVSQQVVECKHLLEKVREQVQNVE